MPLKTKVCRLCNASFVQVNNEKYCSSCTSMRRLRPFLEDEELDRQEMQALQAIKIKYLQGGKTQNGKS